MKALLSDSMKTWDFSGHKLSIIAGDLNKQDTDAIVNAANSALKGGGGVDGAIHNAAGFASLQNACQAIIAQIGHLPTGDAVLTSGFALPATYIIHTVGPIWRGGTHNEPALLAASYRSSLELARERNIETIAFPAISCGSYGYPIDQAMPIALTVMADALKQGLVREIRLVLHSLDATYAWAETATRLFSNPTEE